MIFELLKLCIKRGASDLHFKTGYSPILRIDGNMYQLNDMPIITQKNFEIMLEAILDDTQLNAFQKNQKLDFGYSFSNARFRVNLFNDFRGGNAVFRVIPFKELTFDDIDLPQAARKFADKTSGLVLVTGASGAGKSTTLSAYITYINNKYKKTIITIEEPIEYIFDDNESIISQRQVGVDCNTFEDGINGALQTDCDVIVVGELKDAITVEKVLLAAESGKLVFAALHSNSSLQAIENFIKLCPKNLQKQIATRLAARLNGVVTQTLVSKKSGQGRIAAYEILINSSNIRKLIAENISISIAQQIDANSSIDIISLDNSLIDLIASNKITKDEGLMKANNYIYVKQKVEASR